MISSQAWRVGCLFVVVSVNVAYIFPKTGFNVDPHLGSAVLVALVAVLASVVFQALQARRAAHTAASAPAPNHVDGGRTVAALAAALEALMSADSSFTAFKLALARAQGAGLAGSLEAAARTKLAELAAAELDTASAGTNLEKLHALLAALDASPRRRGKSGSSSGGGAVSVARRDTAEATVACLEALPRGAAACRAALAGPRGHQCSPAARAVLQQVASYGDSPKVVPLVEAAARGHVDAVSALLAAGAHPDGADAHGCTALAWAARGGFAVLVAGLLARGADAGTRDRGGATALDWAKELGHANVVAILSSRSS
jgi:hypothetical protein